MNIAAFEAMADLLIPAGPGMPSASQARVGTAGLAEVLKFRPELKAPLEALLETCKAKTVRAALDSLDSASFGMFAEIVASAYFMNEQVRAKLHYRGQHAHPIIPEEIEPALLKPVMDRGPIYRH